MPDLIAQGPNSDDRWRRAVPSFSHGTVIVIGRSEGDWNVPWDSLISRQHVQVTPKQDNRVDVRKLSDATNAVFYRGQSSNEFTLAAGEHFVIGDTTFTLTQRPQAALSPSSADVTEHAFDLSMLRKRNFRDAVSRIEMLGRLPDLIVSSTSDEELLVRVVNLLLQSTPAASAVAVVASPDAEKDSENAPIDVMHFDSRGAQGTEPKVSSRLVRKSISNGSTTLHLWSGTGKQSAAFTATDDVDWAFCVPLRSEACPGWAIYVVGQLGLMQGFNPQKSLQAAPDNLHDDVKFAELVGTMVGKLRQSRQLERRQAGIRRFFAPIVMEAMARRNTDEVLEPREADLSVMFCDLRGFSARSEHEAGQLLKLLESVSSALGVMTRHILGTGGVIGDFHGDAAMGFWGWPFDDGDTAMQAAKAAMLIRNENLTHSDETGFRCGIGIATGRAVAGRIGTADQVKVTAFGPVVNLASRLEGMTKAFGSEVIIDEPTSLALQGTSAADLGFRIRRLGCVRPAGIHTPMVISELLPPDDGTSRSLTDGQIQSYEAGLDAVINGMWEEAVCLLEELPSWDRPKDTLLSMILRHNRTPPDSWDGVISIPKM